MFQKSRYFIELTSPEASHRNGSGYNGLMSQQEDRQAFTGFGLGMAPEAEGGVFILTVYRDGSLTAAAHATERGAMEAAVDSLEGELDDEAEGGALQDHFVRVQRLIADEGGVMEIVASPVHRG